MQCQERTKLTTITKLITQKDCDNFIIANLKSPPNPKGENGSRTIVPAGDGEERAHVRRAVALQELDGIDAHVVVVALLAAGIQSTLGCVMTRGRIHTTYIQF